MEIEGWTFLCGCAPRTNFVFAARERDEFAADGVVATGFYNWDGSETDPDEQWIVYDEIVNWRARSMASVKPASGNRVVVALGTKGQYFELEPATPVMYVGTMPGLEPLVRRAAAINHTIFAAGMGRSIIRRVGRGNWIEFGPGTTDADRDQVIGFEGIDGVSPDDIYVAGWRGEIWRWFDARWRQIDSPTNANLNAVACSADGRVYVVGDNGTMVRGAGDIWEVVETRRPENLQDVTAFEGDVFVVTDYRILRLGPDGLIEEDRFANGDKPATCLNLLKAEDGSGVVSLGPKDLFVFSGGLWRRII
jgi:hypothetical protein